MNNPLPFQPAAIEHHYALDRACQCVQQVKPRSILIETAQPEMALLAVRRLRGLGAELWLAEAALADVVTARLGVTLALPTAVPDVALLLHARQRFAVPPQAQHVVVVGQNAWSYKSLRRPGQLHDHANAQIRWLRQRYTVTDQIGLFGPHFVARWLLATMWGPRWPALHFQAEQAAMDRLFTRRWWWLSYITILSGTWRG